MPSVPGAHAAGLQRGVPKVRSPEQFLGLKSPMNNKVVIVSSIAMYQYDRIISYYNIIVQ